MPQCFLLGVIAVFADRPVNAVSEREIFLPDFARQIDAAQALEIVHGRGMSGSVTLSFKRTPEGWVMRERDDYPARQELVNETLLALGALQTGAARTAQPKWHRALGLVRPEEFGKAIRFSVRDAEGGLLADVMLGKEEASEVVAVQQTKQLGTVERNFYVRRTDSAQTWLARGRLPRNAQIAAWLDPAFPSLPQERLVAVSAGKGATEDGAGAPLLRRLPDEQLGQAGRRSWLEGFRVCSPKTYRGIRRLISTPPAHCIWLIAMASSLRSKMSALQLCFGRARAPRFPLPGSMHPKIMPLVKRLALWQVR